jgi:hypothetical protein
MPVATAGWSDASAGHAAWPGPRLHGPKRRSTQTYARSLVRSSQATPTETAKAAPPKMEIR